MHMTLFDGLFAISNILTGTALLALVAFLRSRGEP